MTAFAAAVDALFADPNLAQDVVWLGATERKTVRAIERRPDELIGTDTVQIKTETRVLEVRVKELAEPRVGDRIELADGSQVQIKGPPERRDPHGLVWSFDVRRI